ncbi:PREDICTED: espin-like [Amphimedon queenslandica]|uniref:Uncharacterized protein n=1 Tax=Amphimedon queenslandica TaxID=400682 RepID=A0AAN0JHV8_AMPQE|nr:PREDICTED: espin-like [Amphimedon queenslandica]|eukprot:XP_019856238.1 PREDICTED: espin-like [Amphimedon queenslandica]
MATDMYGDTVLYKVVTYGSLDAMKYLIKDHHCDLMATNYKGETVLHYTAKTNSPPPHSPDVIKYLINECNYDPMTANSWGSTPLHYAAHWGHSAIVECLLSTGKCDPLAKNNEGKTPLQVAKEAKQRGWGNTLPIFKKYVYMSSTFPVLFTGGRVVTGGWYK